MVDALFARPLRPNHTHPAGSDCTRLLSRGCGSALGLASITALLCLAAPAFAGSACENPHAAARLEARDMDWVPLEELTEAQRAALPNACCGAYQTPARNDEDALADPAISFLRARADHSEARLQSDIVMEGNVEITQGYRAVNADAATYNQIERKAQIQGDIQIREPGLLLRAEQARIDIDAGDATLEKARFVLHETRIRGEAERLEKFGDRLFRLEHSRFTSCEPGDRSWSIAGSEINIYPQNHYGTARHMRLNVLDVPVIYAPYLRFPVGNERLTGFLFPSLSLSRREGLDEIELPFYWNIAPNYDMTLTPRYMSEHGSFLDTELRHLSSLFETTVDLSYMPSDRGNYRSGQRQLIEQGIKTDYTDQTRWLVNVDQVGGVGQRWSTLIDYTDISDTDYLLDVNGSSLDANRQAFVTQTFAADYRGDNWLVGARTEEFRLLTESQLPYRQLPQMIAEGNYQHDDWLLELNHEYTNFARNSNYLGDRDTLIVGQRLRTDYKLTWNKDLLWGFFKPAIAYKTLNYQLDDRALVDDDFNSPNLQAPQASLDTGLFFEREHRIGGGSFLQTLEPRLFYLYSEYEDHSALYGLTANNGFVNFDTAPLTFNYNQLFRDTRFAGGDRLDDANQVTLGLSSAWIEQATGVERLRLSVGQTLYFSDRQVGIRQPSETDLAEQPESSPIAFQVSGQFSNGLQITSDVFYDHRTERVDSISTSLRYMDDKYRILNLGYRYTREPVDVSPNNPLPVALTPLDQLDASIIWPVTAKWSLIARSNYDFNYELELDTFAGLEYNDCCYRVRVMARRWLNFDYTADFLERATGDDYREGIFLDIQLKGLGNISERIGKLLDRAVIGYNEREQSLR